MKDMVSEIQSILNKLDELEEIVENSNDEVLLLRVISSLDQTGAALRDIKVLLNKES